MSAYRQQADQRTILFCPRCNELLDQVDFGVDMCPRCEGFWIGNSVLELSGHQWPAGPQVWWRNAVRCPACATTGVVTTMRARTSSDVIIDQCFAHGVWLDRGELSRVMQDPAVEELTKLREHLAALEPSEQQLLARRERWEAEQEERGRLAEIERKRIESERAKRAAEAAKTDAQRAEERRQANATKLREAEQIAEARRASEAKHAEWQRVHAEVRIQEDRARIAAAEQARDREIEVVEAQRREAAERQRLAELESHRARALELGRELEANAVPMEQLVEVERIARERVDYLVTRVASLRLQLSEHQSKLVQAREELAEAEQAVERQRRY